jgi:TonB family protein
VKMVIAFVLLTIAGLLTPAQEPQVSGGQANNQDPLPVPPGTRIKVGGKVAAAQIVTRVQPVYPKLARQTRISGTVRLHVILAKDGTVQQLEVMSGHPLLVQSALDAVRQWKYKPTLLNGVLVEVDTTVDVIYSLSDDSAAPDDTQGKLHTATISPEFRADVLNLLEITHARERSAAAGQAFFEKLRGQMFSNIKDEALRTKITDAYLAKLLRMFKTDEYSEGIVVAYSKYFNDDDVKELTKFYQTPVGQKYNEAMPRMTTDLIDLGQKLAQDSIPGIFKELCKEYPDTLGGQLPDCPAPDKDKKSQLMPELVEPIDGHSVATVRLNR